MQGWFCWFCSPRCVSYCCCQTQTLGIWVGMDQKDRYSQRGCGRAECGSGIFGWFCW